MARRFPKETWDHAEHLALRRGWTLEKIAGETNISLAALKKKSIQRQWVYRRRLCLSVSDRCMIHAEKLLDKMSNEGATPAAVDGVQKLIKSANDLSRTEGRDELGFAADVWELVCAEVGAVDPEGAAVLRRHTPMLTRTFLDKFGKGA